MRSGNRVVLAGGTGDLGHRKATALAAEGPDVVALVRKRAAPDSSLGRTGVEQREVDFADAQALAAACGGAGCVVSALNGLEDVVIGQQVRLLDAAVAAGVKRFVPSDFSLDFTRTRPGGNRNLDLRRRFAARADAAPIRVTSILNGGFADLLAGQAPLVQPKIGGSFIGDRPTSRSISRPRTMSPASRPRRRWTRTRRVSCGSPATSSARGRSRAR